MATQTVPASTSEHFHYAVRSLQARGYVIEYWNPPYASLVKRKEINVGALVVLLLVGWMLLWLPLIVYLISFAVASDDRVLIEPSGSSLAAGSFPGSAGMRSPDGAWWWDGVAWQPVTPGT